MKTILPYIYFIAAVAWLTDGFITFFRDVEVYHIFLNYNTENKYSYLGFKLLLGILLIWAGVRRLQMQEKS
ncbi:hypothetical protein AAON49_01335 [Pseudotenacibaculum sp. MALMAid0570]|uniref:hypothetical protein n=1 Tax=Pseudotenacibaculum sp. MALMAid0570 TaxID=3143938 RepID=UPI0032DF29FC